jgi:hypothetical protein
MDSCLAVRERSEPIGFLASLSSKSRAGRCPRIPRATSSFRQSVALGNMEKSPFKPGETILRPRYASPDKDKSKAEIYLNYIHIYVFFFKRYMYNEHVRTHKQ